MQKVAFFKMKNGHSYIRAYNKGASYTLAKSSDGSVFLITKSDDLYFSIMRDLKKQEFGYERPNCKLP